MYRLPYLLSALTVLLLSNPLQAADYSITRSYVRPVIVTTTDDNLDSINGSMVVIAPKFALSANHIVNQAKQRKTTMVTLVGNDQEILTVAASYPQYDLVLLTGAFDCPCAPLGEDPLIDEEVIFVSFPEFIENKTQILSIGLVQNFLKEKIITTTLATSGSSGGGLFVKQDGVYKLVGIATHVGSSQIETNLVGVYSFQQIQWLMYSTSIENVKEFLEEEQPLLLNGL